MAEMPPPYNPDDGKPPPMYTPAVDSQPPPSVILTPQLPQIVTVYHPNEYVYGASSFESYKMMCSYCQQEVMTRVDYNWGTCTWIILVISLLLLWPLIFAVCCACTKDAYHYCPHCNRLLYIKRR